MAVQQASGVHAPKEAARDAVLARAATAHDLDVVAPA